jgi:hypothetical protein
MKTVFIPLILAVLISGIASAAEGNPSKQDIGAMLEKEGSYEHNLVGRRLLRPIDETLLKRLVEQPEETGNHGYILSTWLLRIAAEGDRKYLWLLDRKALRNGGETDDILLAYDYNVNGNKKALETLLDRLRKAMAENRSWGVPHLYALAAINEWDLCKQALGSQAISADGAGGDERYGFWLKRRYFFPESPEFPDNYADFCKEMEHVQLETYNARQDASGKPSGSPDSE